MTRAIFWDNDGVLVDTEHLYFEATRDVLATVGVQLTEAQYIELFLVQGTGAWHLAEQRGIAPREVDALKRERDRRYGELLVTAPRIVAGITDALDALHGKYVMGIVTSSRREHFDLIHQQTGLLKYFDFVLTGDDFTRLKPHPDPYVRAVEQSGVDAEACIAIEDSERGLEAATRAGIRCIVVPSGLTRHGTFAGAHRVLRDISEIPGAL